MSRLNRAVAFLASGRVAVWVMTALLLLLIAFGVVPQFEATSPDLAVWLEDNPVLGPILHGMELTDVRRSVLFYAAYALLMVNLSLCMVRRAIPVLRSARAPRTPPMVTPDWLSRRVPGAGLEAARAVLRARKYHLLEHEGALYGLRGRFALAGHWTFHVGMLLLIYAGAVLTYAPDPFRGRLGVGEGEVVDIHRTPFLVHNQEGATSWFAPEHLPPLSFQLESLHWTAAEGEVREIEATLIDAEGQRHDVGINRPYRHYPFQVMLDSMGFMPGWVLERNGLLLSSAWVKLPSAPGDQADAFSLGFHGMVARVVFEPDITRRTYLEHSEPTKPAFVIEILQGEERLFKGMVAPGQTITLDRKGTTFRILPEIRRYALMEVVKEGEHRPIFAFFFVMIIGLGIRYWKIRKEVVVREDGIGLLVAGRTEMHPHLFAEELEAMVAEITPSGARSPAS